eukprot:CAMPEP_0116889452 /NCGR_PEP_ID=MMETSP0463-20121206/24948_1 /TAXON_ID=181622 /ORGANISM="Strombidinopsis sp, Strain SopsisLIS2011" /LENGTH=48 /DNA_ID= /DNA_START= /DNA_END= /DNA_ORIENTATION=
MSSLILEARYSEIEFAGLSEKDDGDDAVTRGTGLAFYGAAKIKGKDGD